MTAITAFAALTLTACDGSDQSTKDSAKTPVADVRTTVSKDLHAAIKAATPKAVYPKDEFGKGSGDARCSGTSSSVRIVGWDPDESQSNDELLTKSTAYLKKQGWDIAPQVTDSQDQAAKITKSGMAEGLLTAANQGLTFEGTACADS
jgi:hypothetical protein